MIIGDAFIRPLKLEFAQNGFELPDRAQVSPDTQKIFGRVSCEFFLRSLLISIDRNVGKMDSIPTKNCFRIDNDGLRHSTQLPVGSSE